MSKADQLGAGRFGGGARPVSARRAAIGAATGVPTEGVPAPNELPLDRISLNPDNPRSHLGDLTDLAGSLRDHGQKQAITVMNRDAYVKANPDKAAELEPNTTHVVIDGSCRLAAAREAGLTKLKVMVDDEQGTNEDDLLESALVANIHRQDLEPLDEARALERLLGIHGSQTALAARLHRSQGWVSQRLALLNLAPELQERIGQEPIDLLRAVGNKPAEEQQEALEELKARRARKEAEGARRKKTSDEKPGPRPGGRQESTADAYYGVIEGARRGAPDSSASPSKAEQVGETVPEPRGSSGGAAAGGEERSQGSGVLPYHDGALLAAHLIKNMSDVEMDKMLHLLLEYQGSRPTASTAAPTR